jgi:Mn-containing catalase
MVLSTPSLTILQAHQSLAGYKELNKNGPSETYYWEMMEYLAKFQRAHPQSYDEAIEHFDEALGLGEQKKEEKVVNKKARNQLDAILEESDTEDEEAKAKGKAMGKSGKGKGNNKEEGKEEVMEKAVKEKGEDVVEQQPLAAPLDTEPSKANGDTEGQRRAGKRGRA